jgi:uncharacterized protein (TIGR03118 family)
VTLGTASVDPNLLNAWGIAFDEANAVLYAAANHSGSVIDYDTTTGIPKGNSISVLMPDKTAGGSPSGLITAPLTSPFQIPSAGTALLLFATEEGTVAGWNSNLGSKPAQIVINHSQNGAVYKGLAYNTVGSVNTLWVANFHGNEIELFDQNFLPGSIYTTSKALAGYGPFNVVNIGGKMFAAYARQKIGVGATDDSSGAGIGQIITFDASGNSTLFASGGTLNSPWGITKAPANFGKYANDILVGNFGDGTINVFDNSGNFQGQLEDANGKVIVIDGLWGLLPSPSPNSTRVYFSAGPNAEAGGAIGYISLVP